VQSAEWKIEELGAPWIGSEWFSEEDTGGQQCPTGFAMVGLECRESSMFILGGCFDLKCGDYCDDKKIRCRQLTTTEKGSAVTAAATMEKKSQVTASAISCDAKCRALQAEKEAILAGSVSSAASSNIACTLIVVLVSTLRRA